MDIIILALIVPRLPDLFQCMWYCLHGVRFRLVTLEWPEILLMTHTTLFSQREARFQSSGQHQR